MAEAPLAPQSPRHGPCLNCGREIDTNYCPDCGQHNTNHNHGLWQFIQEFLEEFIRFDSKLVRTLVPLITKPGLLTREWVAGRRVRYITPLKLYITMSAICFLAISIKTTYFFPSDATSGVHITRTNTQPSTKVESRSFLDDLLKRKLGNASQIDPKVIGQEFFNRLPTTNFILMPVIAAVFHLLYLRKRRFYVEHLVFTLHFFSFAFLATALTALIPIRLLTVVSFLWISAYLPFAMVRNYEQGWLKTLFKWAIFGIIYAWIILLGLFATFLVAVWEMPDRVPAVTSQK